MAEKKIYDGWSEQKILFPPSFRRKMGIEAGACGDYTDGAKLMESYTTNVKETGAAEIANYKTEEIEAIASTTSLTMAKKLKLGERVPSYTDRVLYTTLPGNEGCVVPGGYELCDNCCNSDHRPVTAVFRVMVNGDVLPGGGGGGGSGGGSGSGARSGNTFVRLTIEQVGVGGGGGRGDANFFSSAL